MANDDQILKDFEEWYSKREFDLKKEGPEDLIDKFSECITYMVYPLTHFEYHDSINFMMDEYGMSFNQLEPDNYLKYYMNYMSVCDDVFSEKLDEIIYGVEDRDDTDDDSSDNE